MKKLALLSIAAALTVILALPADAHKLKRNCLWSGQNIFRVHVMCRDGDSQRRATPARSARPDKPDEPDKPDCKDDDRPGHKGGKHHGKGHGHGKDKD